MYRITWPEKITRVFLDQPGAIWDDRTSGLVARQMEVSLHDLCLENLRFLVSFAKQYAEISRAIFKGCLSLTYVPPLVYQRAVTCYNERHPFFRICVGVEFCDGVFSPDTELDVEAVFASADTESLRTMLRAKFFGNVRLNVWEKVHANRKHNAPDGAANGGAPSASTRALQCNFAEHATQVALFVSSGGIELNEIPEEDDEKVAQTVSAATAIISGTTVAAADPSGSILFCDSTRSLVVGLNALPSDFQDALCEHFRNILTLSEKYNRIDQYLQIDGEVKVKPFQSLSNVHAEEVRYLETEFAKHLSSCFFDARRVVEEVDQYQALLLRFGGRAQQLAAMLHMPPDLKSVSSKPGQNLSRPSSLGSSDDGNASGDDQKYVSGCATTLEEVEEHLQQINIWFNSLKDTPSLQERHLGLFVVDASPLRRALLGMCACCRLRLLGCVQRWLQVDCTDLMGKLKAKHLEIIMLPRTADELHSTLEAVNGLDAFLGEQEPRLARLQDMFQLMERWHHRMPAVSHKFWYDCMHAVPDLRDRAERWRGVFRKDLRSRFNLKIADHAKTLETQCADCKNILDDFASKVTLNKAEFYHSKLKALQARMTVLMKQVKKQHLHEGMMELELSEFPGLSTMVQQIEPLLDLWLLAHEWINWKEEILFGEFMRSALCEPEAVKHKLTSCTETMRRLEEVFASQPRPRQVLHQLSLELTDIQVLLPLIVCLRNPGLRERHWQAIGKAIDQNIHIGQIKEMNLHAMNDRYPFVTHLTEIQAISDMASREMVIEDELRQMQEQWVKLPITIQESSAGGFSSLEIRPLPTRGEEADAEEEEINSTANFRHTEVWELIAEQTVKVQLITQSPHASVHKAELVQHDDKLQMVGELCDLLHESQCAYLYGRDHLASEGMVKDQMQKVKERNKEWKRFFSVDKQWKNIYTLLWRNPNWLALLEVPKILEMSREAAAVMDKIQKAVHEVLDMLRLQVPLMYRLDDASLMQLVRYPSDPSLRSVMALFPGMFALDVQVQADDDQETVALSGFIGDNGEYVQLDADIEMDKESMEVENCWIEPFQRSIKLTMQNRFQSSILSGLENMMDDCHLDENVPLQIRVGALEVLLTMEAERGIDRVESSSERGMLTDMAEMCTRGIAAIQERQSSWCDDQGGDERKMQSESSDGSESPMSNYEDDGADDDGVDDDGEDDDRSDEGMDNRETNLTRQTTSRSVSSSKGAISKGSSKELSGDGGVESMTLQQSEKRTKSKSTERSGGVESMTPKQYEKRSKSKERREFHRLAVGRTAVVCESLLPGPRLQFLPRRVFFQGCATITMLLLKWRDMMNMLAADNVPSRHSFQWMMVLRHYVRDSSEYRLEIGGFCTPYGWNYLGGPGQVYVHPLTNQGLLTLAHAFSAHRGVLSASASADTRSEPTAILARAMVSLRSVALWIGVLLTRLFRTMCLELCSLVFGFHW
jgi:hypothetical protein